MEVSMKRGWFDGGGMLLSLGILLACSAVGVCEVLQQNTLTADTTKPAVDEVQYVGINYANGGTYSIKITKAEQTSGTVWVWYQRSTNEIASWGSKHKMRASDNWYWDPTETGYKQESGSMFVNTTHEECEIGRRTWRTRVEWIGRLWTGTEWILLSSGSDNDDHVFSIEHQ